MAEPVIGGARVAVFENFVGFVDFLEADFARGIALGLLLVHRLAELHGSLRQRVGLGLDRLGIVTLQRFLQIADGVLDGAALALLDLRTMFGQRFLGRVHQSVGMVLGVDRFAAF